MDSTPTARPLGQGDSRSPSGPTAGATIAAMATEAKLPSGAAANEATRLRRLREDARRPLSVNLAEGIALSHKLMQFVGTARKSF